MKKFIVLIVTCIFTATLFGQTEDLNREQLLLKSRKQKTTGTILIASGGAICIIGSKTNNENSAAGTFFAGAATLFMGSMFLIGGHNLRKKAGRISSQVHNETLYLLPSSFGKKTIPVLAVSLKLGTRTREIYQFHHQPY